MYCVLGEHSIKDARACIGINDNVNPVGERALQYHSDGTDGGDDDHHGGFELGANEEDDDCDGHDDRDGDDDSNGSESKP